MKLFEIAQILDIEFVGNGDYEITNISSLELADKQSIVLVSKKKYLNTLNNQSPGAVLTSVGFKKYLKNKNLLISDNPILHFAKLTYFLQNNLKLFESKVGKNFVRGSNVFIGENVLIGDNVNIGHNVVINSNVCIGNDVNIDSGTVIGGEGFGNVLAPDSSWIHLKHLGGVIIGNNVSIGSNCCIDKGTLSYTQISDGVIIDNLVHIAHNVFIGENSAIAAKVGIAGSCRIGKRNMIGGMVGIIDHVYTSDDVIISATSTVYKNIQEPGVYTGIIPISKHVTWKRIALWISKLDKIVKFTKFKQS